jgi:Domain of unknown function (DUF5679)
MQHQNSDQYPNAYCVKCGGETPTNFKHTVVLANHSRALKGLCSQCESEVYRIMPKINAATDKTRLSGSEKRRYPDAFCLKCQAHTPTKNAHTVLLDNHSRAVTGQCGHCNHDVYRIIGPVAGAETKSEKINTVVPSHEPMNPAVPLPIRVDLKPIRPKLSVVTNQRTPKSGLIAGVLMGLIAIGLALIGMMAIHQL